MHNIFSKTLKVKLSTVKMLSYLYLSSPCFLFLATWVNWKISVFLLSLSILLLLIMYRNTVAEGDLINIPTYIFLFLIIVAIVWPLVSGIGNVFLQSRDFGGRNPLFMDLIKFSWPVIYPENGRAIVYYLGHWIVPALIGKVFGWYAAQIALVLWTALGILLMFLFLCFYLKVFNKFFIIFVIIFIFFYELPFKSLFSFRTYDTFTVLLSSSVQLRYIFNQAIAIWLLGMLFLHEKGMKNFIFLASSIIFYSPYTFISIGIFMIAYFLNDTIKNKKISWSEILCIQNILSFIIFFPILYLYLSTNSTSTDGLHFFSYSIDKIPDLLLSYLIQFGIFMILIFNQYKKCYLYWTIPIIFIGVSFWGYAYVDANFVRTNIIAWFILLVLMLKYLLTSVSLIRKGILILFIVITFRSNIRFFYNQIKYFIVYGIAPLKDCFSTFNRNDLNLQNDNIARCEGLAFKGEYPIGYWILMTFTTENPQDTIFFKYLAKSNSD
ncbi:hypothetical protein SAMN02745150_01200 [Brevinema andersonii]|uniref:Uncharacterized protein n=1 Tax=Brevinema andersonii TaxID=34097 RepID=A0A1I1EPQ4_BREAD|nr:hypothetical protein SAMN02745150_01200 [Brevinema andersonii]